MNASWQRWMGYGACVLMVGCAGASTSPAEPIGSPVSSSGSGSPAVSSVSSESPDGASSAASATMPSEPELDRCAIAEPKLVVPSRRLISGFDIAEGRIFWLQHDVMTSEMTIHSLALDQESGEPELVHRVPMVNDPDALVVSQTGFWLGVDDVRGSVCKSQVMWLGKAASRAVPVSEPACVFGPLRVQGAEAMWATGKTHSHPMQVSVAVGAPPGGITSLSRKADVFFDTVWHASDGVYYALERDEVIRRRPDGVEEQVVGPVNSTLPRQPKAIALWGNDIILASSQDSRKVELVRIARTGGTRSILGSFDVHSSVVKLFSNEGGLVMLLRVARDTDKLLLIDPRAECPIVELPVPDRRHRMQVVGNVAYVLQQSGIMACSFAARSPKSR